MQLANTSEIAVDTEFVRDKTYFPKLCLIQIASKEMVVCIDPLAIPELGSLKQLLCNPAITKVFHAARQDLEVLLQTLGAIPAPIFDTQIAATLLGLGEQIGYANLIKHYLQINLPKGHARADWEQRPLSVEQLEYAANDVRYLAQVYPIMQEKLRSLGRTDWLVEDFAELTTLELYQTQPAHYWNRISGLQKLRGVQLAVLQKLAAWREETARQKDRPRKWILPDDILITLSLQMPEKNAQLARIRGLNNTQIERHGEQLLALIAEAKSLPESAWPRLSKRYKLNRQQEVLVDTLMAVVKIQAVRHEISAGAITSKSDLEKLAAGERDIPLLHGWRLGIAGQAVLDFLHGKSSLHFADGEPQLR